MSTGQNSETINDELCFYFLFEHPITFRDCFMPELLDKPYRTRYYQYTEALSEDCVLSWGRGGGKSFSVEPTMLQRMINCSNKESLLTAFRKIHVRDRCENLIRYLWTHQYFKQFLISQTSLRSSVQRSIIYEIKLRNGHHFFGISVGDDPLAAMILGKHPQFRYMEEAATYPRFAWLKFRGAADPAGCHDKFFGVPDGRRDSPFYQMCTKLRKFANNRFRFSKRLEPHYDKDQYQDDLDVYGSEDSPSFQGEVDAIWGEPVHGAWNEEDIMNCFDKTEDPKNFGVLKNRLKIINISSEDYEGLKPADLLASELRLMPKNRDMTIIAIDIGSSQPTVILPFYLHRKRWCLNTMINLTDKMLPPQQTEIVDYIADRYEANYIGIDCTSDPSIASNLQNPRGKYKDKNYEKRVVWAEFQRNIVMNYMRRYGKIETKASNAKLVTWHELEKWFASQNFLLSWSDKIIEEFHQETRKFTGEQELLVTPPYIHIPETFRVFMYVIKTQINKPEKPRKTKQTHRMVPPSVGQQVTSIFRSDHGT